MPRAGCTAAALLERKSREIAWRDARLDKLNLALARPKRSKFGAKTEAMNAQQRALFTETLGEDEASRQAQLAADSRLLERSQQHLVKAARAHGLRLRQNYNRCAPRLAVQVGRYAHAKQYKRMRKVRSRVGRVHRYVERQLHKLPEQATTQVRELLQRTGRILTQGVKDKHKLYALHAPKVECIAKGKARTPYEFGVKVSVATTLREGLVVVGMRSMPGNPYDGHTLAETLEQVGILAGTEKLPATAIVDKGYQGVEVAGVRILRSGQKRGITKTLRAMIKRCSAVEPTIGHMKMDGRLARNPLKGALGDAIHAVMCGAGHNLRLILATLRLSYARIGVTVQDVIELLARRQRLPVAAFA